MKPAIKTSANDIRAVARKHFGFESLRPGQEEAIRALVDGRDTLVVQPTGAGKSAIYQIAGLMIEGVTVVVSPLIALQKDQVDSIMSKPAAEAVLVNSQQRAEEHRDTLEKIEEQRVEYVLLAPEQLRRPETLDRLAAASISLFVVDEAHCISEWGHDFRPDYAEIGPRIELLGHPAVLAMTATASREVRDEIVLRLGMRDPFILVHGFDRPNISLRVEHFETEHDKFEDLVHRVRWAKKPGIVYAATRKNAEQIARLLDEAGVHALCYHAGLKASERVQIQDRFMAGDAEVIVATNAFGMGVDKADVRFVYHFDISGSLDAYYQEIGRAGRDGEEAEAILFYRDANIGAQKFRTGQGKLEAAQVQQIAEAIANAYGPIAPKQLAQELQVSDRKITAAVHRLADVGAVEILPEGQVRLTDRPDMVEAAQHAVNEQRQHQEMRREKLRQMQEYADSTFCRRALLLSYFGEEFQGPCHNCDNCRSSGTGGADAGAGTRREVA